MSQTTEEDAIEAEDVQREMLDANEALKNGDYQTAFGKLKDAQRKCGILIREGEDGR